MTASVRIQARPSPEQWGLDELLTLPEAASLFWPDGEPLGVSSLRVAVRDGTLPATIVAGKLLTTKRAVMSMSVCRPIAGKGAEPAVADERSFHDVANAAAMEEPCASEGSTKFPRRHR